MYDLGMARISATRNTRVSQFSGAAVDSFTSLGRIVRLGSTAQDSYNQAKPAIAKFDSLVERTKRIANQSARDTIAVDYGLTDPSNKDKALYMRNALAGDVADAEKYTPIAYEQGFPALGPSRGRVTKLENFNSDFSNAVLSAENYYGILPEPQVITNYVTTTTTNPLNWIVPVIALGAGLGLAALAGLFGKK